MGIALVALTASSTFGAMRAPLWVWIAGVGKITDTDCIARGGEIAKHPGEGSKQFCDLKASARTTLANRRQHGDADTSNSH